MNSNVMRPTRKDNHMNSNVMRPTRIAYIQVIGKLWMGGKGTYEYNLSDKDLEEIQELTRETVRAWLNRHGGDFQSIIDFRIQVGEEELEWEDADNATCYLISQEG